MRIVNNPIMNRPLKQDLSDVVVLSHLKYLSTTTNSDHEVLSPVKSTTNSSYPKSRKYKTEGVHCNSERAMLENGKSVVIKNYISRHFYILKMNTLIEGRRI